MMEAHRHDLVVILAGYPDKMETLLNQNPGLRSRFPNRLHFMDYTGILGIPDGCSPARLSLLLAFAS